MDATVKGELVPQCVMFCNPGQRRFVTRNTLTVNINLWLFFKARKILSKYSSEDCESVDQAQYSTDKKSAACFKSSSDRILSLKKRRFVNPVFIPFSHFWSRNC